MSFNIDFIAQKALEIPIGHDIDYFELFKKLRSKYPSCYLLESLASPKHQDRYFAFGFDPFVNFSARGNTLQITGPAQNVEKLTDQNQEKLEIPAESPYQTLQTILPKNIIAKTHQGGLVGYVGYEAVNYFEPSLNLTEHPDFPTFLFGLYLDGLLFDSETSELYYYTFYQDRSQEVLDVLNSSGEKTDSELVVTKLGPNQSKQDYSNVVERTLQEIRSGNTFQAEVGFKTKYKIKGDKIGIYENLRTTNPSPYMYYLKSDDIELFGASPEIVVASTNKRVLTTPAAGTAKRGLSRFEDVELARNLLNDPKEIAEHNMLIDLHRNDLSRVCQPGSVQIAREKYLIKFSHVQHIVSDIIGQLRDDLDSFDLLASICPCGVLTGAPKIETIKIIDQNETEPRGPYGGAVGRFSFNGDCVFCMPIRSLFCKAEDCFTQTCSGIVYDSSPEKEYTEIINKLAAMEQVINEVGK